MQEGFRVEQAQDGAEAVDRARTLRPDVIVLDLSLPVMDGWEATRVLKSDPRTRAIPVIALSGHPLAADKRSKEHALYHGLLMKPCSPKTLLEMIDGVLGRSPA
jgi:CheY-like chemotaxis protein